MIKNDLVISMIDNYNSKVLSNVNKIFTDRTQFVNMLKTLHQYKNTDIEKMLCNIEGEYYVYENVLGPKGMDLIRCLGYISWRVDRSFLNKLVEYCDKEYISYDDFIKKESENNESEQETLKRIKNKYPKLFVSSIWYYKYINNVPISKGPIDIAMEHEKAGMYGCK